MENSLKQLDDYLKRIEILELVKEEQNYSTEVDEEITEVSDVKNGKSNTVDDDNKSSSLCETNMKSILFTNDLTPCLHNMNNYNTESCSVNINNDQVLGQEDANFIDNVKTESLHFEESEEVVNELEAIGLNKQNLQNYATCGTLTSSPGNAKLVHPVALKKSAVPFRKPKPVVQPESHGQVTTLLDISSISELKRLWVRKETIDKRANAASSKQIHHKSKLPVCQKNYKTMNRHRPGSDIGNKMSNMETYMEYPTVESDCNSNRSETQNGACTKSCIVKLVRVENLPNPENLKIDLFYLKNCIPKRLEDSMPEKLHGKITKKKQVLNKIKEIHKRKCLNHNKSKTVLAAQKQTSGTWNKNSEPEKNTSLLKAAVSKICKKKVVVRMEKIKDQQVCKEVVSVQDKVALSGDTGDDSCIVIKSESSGNIDDNDYGVYDDNFDDDEIPSDDDNDDDYHPKKRLKRSKNKKRPKSHVNDLCAVKCEDDRITTNSENKKINKVIGTRIGRPPVLGHFECKLCDFTANEKNLITKHHFNVHRLVLKCEPCDKVFKSVNKFLEHNAYNHDGGKPFKCEHEGCPYASKNPTDLSRHQSKHETELRHVCSICGWRTKWRRNMRHHHVMKHCDERNYHCSICNFAAKRKQDLKYHLFRHSDEKPIQCLTCGFRVKTNFELRSHMLVHTNVKPFKCTIPGCSSAAKTKSDLTKHMRIHQTERPYKCHICSKTYKDQFSLNKHLRGIHVEGRKFNCDICGKKFKNRYALKKHVYLHSGFKPYDCSVCGWKFANRNNLEKHMVTHDTKDRPYLCPICPYAAKTSDHLLTHIGSFHGDKYAYFCEMCSKPFKRYIQLKLHYERMHTKEEVEKLKNSVTTDLAVLKMEMQLEEEENEAANKRKRKLNCKNAVSETEVKKEPIDEEYGEATCNKAEDFDNVFLNEDSGMIEIVKKRKLNSTHSETREKNYDDDSRTDIVNTEVDTELKNTDNVFEKDVNEFQMQQDRSDNILIAKNERITVSVCNNLRLPLATRGFKFNYDKTGKKPAKSWFMDTSLMDKKTAERHKKYSRRVGLLPPIPKGHPTKGYKRLKKFVDKRKKQLAEKIKKAKCSKEIKQDVRRNAPRNKRFLDKYNESAETTEDEMSEVENYERSTKEISIDKIKEIPNDTTNILEESDALKIRETRAKSSSETQNTLNDRKDIFRENKVNFGKSKAKLSSKTEVKMSKLLLSSERKTNIEKLNIRKPVFLEKVCRNPFEKEVNENGSDVIGNNPSNIVKNDSPGVSVTEAGNNLTDETENERINQHIYDKNSASGNLLEISEDPENEKAGKVRRKQYLKKTVQHKLKKLLQCKNGEMEKVLSDEKLSTNKECNLDKKMLEIRNGMESAENLPFSKPLHVPVKDTQVVMVYPTKISQNTNMGEFSCISKDYPVTVTDNTSDSETTEVKTDLDVIRENISGDDTNGNRDGNSDKEIMQHEYLAFIKQEPDLHCQININLQSGPLPDL